MTTLLDESSVSTALAEPAVWPNLSQTAHIVGLSKGTLCKRAHAGQIAFEVIGLGRGQHVLSPQEVLRVGFHYRRIPQAALVESLASFFVPRLHAEAKLIQRVLWNILNCADWRTTSHSAFEAASEGSNHGIPQTNRPNPDETPRWLLEVEELRTNPEALIGPISFITPDDLRGKLVFGASIDLPRDVDLADWQLG